VLKFILGALCFKRLSMAMCVFSVVEFYLFSPRHGEIVDIRERSVKCLDYVCIG
jgi:hypothetical protein